jgi:hypothetical protein
MPRLVLSGAASRYPLTANGLQLTATNVPNLVHFLYMRLQAQNPPFWA